MHRSAPRPTSSLRMIATGLRRYAATRLRRHAQDEEGGMAITAFFVFLLMLTMGGISIDLMRHEMERTRLQATLDSAVLAAANLRQDRDPREVVEDYFTKAGQREALNDIDASDYETLINSREIRASADFTLNTYLMRLMGVETLGVAAAAAATQAVDNIEVSLVLDISGSMRFDDRIGALRPAARTFVSTLLAGDAATTTSINLVPYAGNVNPGPVMFERMGGVRYGTTGENFFAATAPTDMTAFYYDRDTSDAVPYDYVVNLADYDAVITSDINKDDLDSYLHFADAFIRRESGVIDDGAALVGISSRDMAGTVTPVLSRFGLGTGIAPVLNTADMDETFDFALMYDDVIPQTSSCIEIGDTDFDHADLPDAGTYAQTPHFMNWDIAPDPMDWGWCPEDDTSIVYASNNEGALHTYIDAMRLHDGTGTHYGVKYGLALLNPSSNDDFIALNIAGDVPTAFANRPLPFEDPDVQKYMVLMTDGRVTEQVRPRASLDPRNRDSELQNRTADRRQLTPASDNVESFDAICDAAKANNIIIYTIAFETTEDGQNEMRRCASSSANYFEASTQNIGDVFSSIARQITQLRLTQ